MNAPNLSPVSPAPATAGPCAAPGGAGEPSADHLEFLALLDGIDLARSCLDDAEKLLGDGARMAGMVKLGQAVAALESCK